MDGTLPSYEAAMREARAYLRRRDLSSQEEIPLYFAWQRLYAAANANISTDFLQETKEELRARQEARLAPRRGIPPPLFTSFDKVHRTSAQASAFLRSKTSSDVAIEMMARRYRREAEKLRSSREKLISSLNDAEKRMKKTKRQKSPEQDVEELLESIGRPGIGSEDDNLLSGKSMMGKLTGTSSTAAKRMKKINQRVKNSEEDDQFGALSDDQLGTFAHKSKTRVFGTKGKLGVANSKGDFGDGLGSDGDPAKTTELRRSSLSKQNPATIPLYSNMANVAAFAARVSDWRMPPDIDNAPLSPDLSRKRVESITARGKRLSGANELRESALVEGEEGDMTLNSSVGSSGLEDDTLDLDDSPDMDTARSSPTSRSNKTRKEVGKSDKDKSTSNRDQQGANIATRTDKSNPISDTSSSFSNVDPTLASRNDVAARGSEFHQKLIQLSHAVGDMQVKIQGKQIEVTFKGALDHETESKRDGTATKSSIESSKIKQPSLARKVLDTTDSTSHERDEAGGAQGIAQPGEQFKNDAKGASAQHKQSDVRFADTASSDGNDNNKKEKRFGDQQPGKNESDRHQMRGASSSAAIPPAIYEGQPRQIQSSRTRESASRTASAAKSVQGEDDSEIDDASVSREQHRFTKSQHENDEGEVAQRIARSMEQVRNTAKGRSAQRKQSGVRFADANSSDDDNYKEEKHVSDQQGNRNESDQQHMRDGSTSGSGSAMIPPAMYEGQPRQIRSSSESKSRITASSSESVLEENDSETKDAIPLQEQHRFVKAQQNPIKGEGVLERGDEGHLDKDTFRASVQQSNRVDIDADRMNANEEHLSERQENRRAQSEGRREQVRPPKSTVHDVSSDSQGALKSDRRQEPSHHRSRSSGRDHIQAMAVDDRTDASGHGQTMAATNDRNDSSGRGQHTTARDDKTRSSRRSQDMSATDDSTEASGRGQNVAVRDDKNNSSGRGQSMAAIDSRTDEDNGGSENSNESISVEQQSRPSRGDQQRQSHRDVDNDSIIYEPSTTTKRESRIPPDRHDIDYDAQSFSDASEDDMDDDQEVNSIDESVLSTSKNSSRSSTKQVPQKSSGEISSRERNRNTPETLDYERKRQPSSPFSRNEPVSSDLDSDDDFSDGPDTPKVKQHSRKHTERKLSRVPHDFEAQTHSKRFSSRSNSTRHHDKRNSRLLNSDSENDRNDESFSDDDSRYEDQSSHTRHRSRNADRAQPHHSNRNLVYQSLSKKYSTREHSSRDVYFPFSLDLPPKKVEPVTRPERNSKTRSASRSKKPYKIPEGIVWPPGMEEECIARLGLDGHHPIAPPGLEHLVTEEQWGDYWTWLHWYSSWQMWYMKNGKKPRRKSGKEKRSDRHRADVDEYPDIDYTKHGSRNANWWVDVGSRKRQHRHRRDRNTE